jgi:hypothetical protein
VKVRKDAVNANSDLAVRIQGDSYCKLGMNLYCYLVYEKSCDINLVTGVVENIVMAIGVLFIYIVGLYGGFIGFFMTYMFQIYNSGFMMFGLAWTFGLFLLSWIPPLLNFFG